MTVLKPLGEHELLIFLLQFLLLLVTARALGVVASRLGLPSVVGELVAGLLLGPSLLGNVAPGLFAGLFPQKPEQFHLLEVISWLGVIMLLILTGLETDIGLIARKAKSAAAISLGGIAVPFATGVGLGYLLPQTFLASPDKRLVFALFIGTAMSISAIPVIAKVLMEMNVIRRDIGQITLAAGMIDDTIGWILLSVVAGLASSGAVSPGNVGRSLLSVVVVLVVAYTVGRRVVSLLLRTIDNHVGGDSAMITTLMALALGFAAATQALHLEAVLGAFIAGILVGQVKRFDDRLRHIFEQVALGVFAPVFFAAAGLRVDLAKLARPNVAAVGVLVLFIATAGKFVGAYLGARASRQGHWESLSLGAGMNARGAMEIIVATIGFTQGILTAEMYSIILMVAVVTSLMAPPILRWTLSHVHPSQEEQHRLEAEERRKGSFVANLKRVLVPVASDYGRTLMAATVVRLLIEDEDVEVTSLALQSNRPAGHRRPRTSVHDEVADARSIARAGAEPSRAILTEADRGYDLVVLDAATRGTTEHGPLFEDFVDEVIQEAPCPFLIVSAADDDGPAARIEGMSPSRILVPTSGNGADRHAAEVAFAMAAHGHADVDLIHVVTRSQHELRMGTDSTIQQAVKIGEDIVARTRVVGEAMGVTVTTDVLVADHPEQAIVERAEHGADMVVMGSGRRPTTHRAFFGHRIDYVITHARCPVAVLASASGTGPTT